MTAEEAYREYRNLEVYDADEVDCEIKRLREALDAAEKVVEAARKYECEELDGELSQALAEFDKLKEKE